MASHMQPQDCDDGCCGEEGTNEPPVGCSEPLDCLQGAYGFKSVFVPPPLAVASSPYGNPNCVNIGVQTIASSQPAVDVAGTYPACSLPLWVPRDMTTPCTRKWVFEDGLTTYTGRQRGCGGTGYELDVTVKRIKVELVAVAIPTGLTGVTINETLEVIGFPSGAGGAGALQIGDTLTLCTKYQRFPAGRLFGEVQINIAGRDIFRTDKDTGISTVCGSLLTPTSQLFCNYPDKVYMQFCQDCEWEFWIENCALNWEVTNGYAITIKRVGAHWLGNGGVVHSSTNPTGSFTLEPGQRYLAEVHCSILDVNRLFPYQAGYFELNPIVHDDCSVACGTNCSDDWGLEQNPAACYPCGCHRGQGIGNELSISGTPDVLNQFTSCPVVGGNYLWHRWEGYGVLNGSWAWVPRAVRNSSGFYNCNGDTLFLGEARFITEQRITSISNAVERGTTFQQFRLLRGNGWGIQFRERFRIERDGVIFSDSDWFNWNTLLGNSGTAPPQTNEHCGLWITNFRTVFGVRIDPEVCGSNGWAHLGGITVGGVISRAMPAYLGNATFAAYVENPLCP
jgi:hypothetical protein